MGRGDSRRSMKMRRKKAQVSLKLRIKRKIAAAKKAKKSKK
jgi:hypothetical protein